MLSVSVYLLNSFIMLNDIYFCGYQNFNDMLFAYIFTVWIKIKNNCKKLEGNNQTANQISTIFKKYGA